MNSTSRLFFVLGALFAGTAVAAGAFGAHALKNILTSDMLQIFETGVRYQMYHAFALIVTSWVIGTTGSPIPALLKFAGWSFAVGIILFSGTLYILALSGEKWLGALTPFGGLCFILGWIFVAVGTMRRKLPPSPYS